MSKYDELCQAYATSRHVYVEYRDACFGFSQALLEAMIHFLEVPDGRIRLVPVNREPDPEAVYSLAGAMHLDEDSYWHFGVVVDLGDPAGTFPPQAVLLKLLVKRHEGTFCLKLGQEGEDIEIREGYSQDLGDFMENVFLTIKESYEQGLQQFLDKEETTRKIGFEG